MAMQKKIAVRSGLSLLCTQSNINNALRENGVPFTHVNRILSLFLSTSCDLVHMKKEIRKILLTDRVVHAWCDIHFIVR